MYIAVTLARKSAYYRIQKPQNRSQQSQILSWSLSYEKRKSAVFKSIQLHIESQLISNIIVIYKI